MRQVASEVGRHEEFGGRGERRERRERVGVHSWERAFDSLTFPRGLPDPASHTYQSERHCANISPRPRLLIILACHTEPRKGMFDIFGGH